MSVSMYVCVYVCMYVCLYIDGGYCLAVVVVVVVGILGGRGVCASLCPCI